MTRARASSVNIVLIGLGIAALILLIALVGPWVAPERTIAVFADEYPVAKEVYQVSVRNGAGASGAAERMRQYLRSKGYDVVEVGNHTSFDVQETLIVDRIGNLDAARQVAATLGLSEDRIRRETRKNDFLHASIIIGQDFELLPPFASSPTVGK